MTDLILSGTSTHYCRVSPEETLEWYKVINKLLERHGISRAAWSYKEMDFGISDARMDKVREDLITYL